MEELERRSLTCLVLCFKAIRLLQVCRMGLQWARLERRLLNDPCERGGIHRGTGGAAFPWHSEPHHCVSRHSGLVTGRLIDMSTAKGKKCVWMCACVHACAIHIPE